MGLLFELFKELGKDKESEKNKDYDLEDYKKELIDNEQYEPYNFEEEEPEEDDYFYEDEE